MTSLMIALITVALKPSEARERHIEALTNEVRAALPRLLIALGLGDPKMLGGSMRVPGVGECPQCGAVAPTNRPADLPWLYSTKRILCAGGCEFDFRQVLELYADTNAKIDRVLAKISVGRPTLTRFYALELQLNTPAEGDEPKRRRVVGDNVIDVLRRLEVTGDSIVRGVCVDAIDQMTATAALRSEDDIPWRQLPLDHKGELMDIGWHGAPLSRNEREIVRRRHSYNLAG